MGNRIFFAIVLGNADHRLTYQQVANWMPTLDAVYVSLSIIMSHRSL